MTEPASAGDASPTTPNAPRRQRAPTITIDTSAVSPSLLEDDSFPLHQVSDKTHAVQGDQDRDQDSPQVQPPIQQHSPSELRLTPSFESRDSRPTSPHNVSSPTSKWTAQPHGFLSVPNTRSRGNSVDTNDSNHSPSSYGGDTYVSSPASSALGDSTRQTSTVHSNDHVINDEDALKPDPGTEPDFEVEDNKFAFVPGQLSKLLNPKSFSAFHALGGLKGIEKGLRTDRFTGLSVDEKFLDGTVAFDAALAAAAASSDPGPPDRPMTRSSTMATAARRSEDYFVDRKRIFKDNRLPEKKAKSIFELTWLAYNDKVLILLTVAAVVSLALGIYQSVKKVDGESVQWVEGVAIMVAIILVVVVGAANDWQKERQFVKLNKKKEDRNVKVIRSGRSKEISVHDILVGDVMHLEPGDLIPVDGIFVSGHNVKCDESSATGESDLLRKHPGDEVYAAIETHQSLAKLDPFIISGGKVTEGIGTFLVTAVGVNSSYGKTMMSLREDAQTTPLQSKLNVLAEYIAKLGLGAGLILFVATFIKFLVHLNSIQGGASAKGQQFLNVFIVAVTIVVVAVPEGLPLAVTLALAFATTRMMKDNNLVRLLRACETMGNATTICSDKTGTLTQNRMSTVAGIVGTSNRFGDKKTPESTETNSPQSPIKDNRISLDDRAPDQSTAKFVSALHKDVFFLLKQSIALNSTAFEGEVDGEETFIGSKTETALLSFARDYLAMGPLNEERSNATVVQLIPFDSGRKCMATVIRLDNGNHRMFVKGASELMLDKCQRIIKTPTQGLLESPLTEDLRRSLGDTINAYASRSLRTIGFLYKDYEQWPPKGAPTQEDDARLAVFDKVFGDMVFLGIVGIQDPLRVGVPDAVRACQNAGVFVRMVTGDNLLTAKAIAEECGIYVPGGIVMEGPEFRKLSRTQMDQTIPRLQVLARSSPDDKRILVKRLKELGETVAVTGDGTNDAPALKTADVGFSMGIAGTEVAKEASAIILMDDNFASIVKAIMWGRAVNDSVKKFLQFQVTVNITAVFLTFISAVANENEESVLTAVQLLWVNLIMDTFAALALATDPPTPSILNRKPEPKSAPLITLNMWKMIIGQSIFQLAVTLILYFAGESFLPFVNRAEASPGQKQAERHDQLQTLVFNTFVWMQIFNQYNNRRLDNKLNIFEGAQRNYFFIGIQFIIVAGQIMIVFVGGRAFSTVRLNGPQWAFCLILGLISLPVAVLLRLIPDEHVRKLVPRWFARKAPPEVRVSDEERQYEWNPALVEIKEELSFIKMLRGGRLNMLVYKLQHPRETLLPRSRSASRASSIPPSPAGEPDGSEYGSAAAAPPTPESRRSTSRRFGRSRSNSAFAPAAAMAGIVAGSVAGWSPIGRREEEASTGFSESRGRSELESREGVEVHPRTSTDDPIIAQNPGQNKDPPSQVPELTPAFGQSLAPPHRKP
ncbi:MAG: hypothetical protein L6R40_008207 [Gallowayella cf. fulva]|nr:MAG: hypothetical protein L6R40_008207 [Xanthomendoza cf. fulva]